MPAITVAITAYNTERYIGGVIDELFAQTMQDFNIVILDDCSKDRTREIINSRCAMYPDRIRVIYPEKNYGSPAKSRNALIDSGLLDGKYTILLDGDDSAMPNYLETLYRLCEDTGADMAICSYERVDADTGHVLCREVTGFPSVVDMPPRDDMFAFLNSALWNKLVRTSLLMNMVKPDINVGDDLCFSHALYAQCKRVAFTDEVLFHYRVRPNSTITRITPDAAHEFAQELLRMYKETPIGNTVYRETLLLLAFIHIGISMTLRINDNKSQPVDEYIRWARNYFRTNFNFFRGCSTMKLKSLSRHGIKGIALWGCKLLYRIGAFRLFVWIYSFVTRVFHIDFKF